MNLTELREDWDWGEAFAYASDEHTTAVLGWGGDASGFRRADVAEVIAASAGEDDGANWVGVFRLVDGRYAYLEAGCNYTGWDCQSSGHAVVGPDLATIVRLALDGDARARLGLRLEGGP